MRVMRFPARALLVIAILIFTGQACEQVPIPIPDAIVAPEPATLVLARVIRPLIRSNRLGAQVDIARPELVEHPRALLVQVVPAGQLERGDFI
jgi:hypothetical protein